MKVVIEKQSNHSVYCLIILPNTRITKVRKTKINFSWSPGTWKSNFSGGQRILPKHTMFN